MRPTQATLETLARDSGVRIHVLVEGGAQDEGPLAEAARTLSREAERATRYLGLKECDSLLVECSGGALAVRRAEDGERLIVLSAPAQLPLGHAQRLLDRAAAIANGAGS